MPKRDKGYNVIIVGGGITGASLFYVLSNYTNIGKIALLEKYDQLATVNSNYINNSQTLHFGDIETNYTLEKARHVKEAAEMVVKYLEKYGQGIFVKGHKMVLGLGKEETEELAARYEEFKSLFPDLKKLNKNQIAEIEPLVTLGRNPKEEIMALYTEDGYAVNFKKLSGSFVAQALSVKDKRLDVLMNTEVVKVKRKDNQYILIDSTEKMFASTIVVFAAGPHSLVFARSLGYGKNIGILPVAGNFYLANDVLRGKVYMVQIKKMPFAAVHGDPNVENLRETRFGPTIRVLPLLERHNYATIVDFLKTSVFTLEGVLSLLTIISDKIIIKYIFRNILYDLPFLGKKLFLRWEVKKIVPSLTADKITLGHNIGGIRPQVVNVKTRKMEMGEAEITGENVIFNITPSPGASVCLKNAEQETLRIVKMLGARFEFDAARWCQDFGSKMGECQE
jgi:malate dehydrogenase (quinone)